MEVAVGSRASTWESDLDVAAECTFNVLVVSSSLVVEAASSSGLGAGSSSLSEAIL